MAELGYDSAPSLSPSRILSLCPALASSPLPFSAVAVPPAGSARLSVLLPAALHFPCRPSPPASLHHPPTFSCSGLVCFLSLSLSLSPSPACARARVDVTALRATPILRYVRRGERDATSLRSVSLRCTADVTARCVHVGTPWATLRRRESANVVLSVRSLPLPRRGLTADRPGTQRAERRPSAFCG